MTGKSGGVPRVDQVKRIFLYGVLILVTGTAQCGFFAPLSICPATPDLVLGVLCAIALLDSGKAAMIAAIPAGFFMDAIGGSGIALLPLIYFLIATCIGSLAAKLLPRFLSYVVLLLPGVLLRALFTFLQILLAYRATPSFGALVSVLLPEMLCTAVVCLPLYSLTRLARIPLVKKSKFSF